MTTDRHPRTDRHHNHHDFRKDLPMLYLELRLAEAHERQALLRSIRESGRRGPGPRRPFRRQIGESLMRLGRRIAGDHASTPAWSG